MSRKVYLIIFAAVMLTQWAVPGWIILESESVLSNGEEYHFQTQPVDPTDPFRGKYITLHFEENSINVPAGQELSKGDKVYVALDRNEEGYAILKGLYRNASEVDGIAMQAIVEYVSPGDSVENVLLQNSFEKFFLEESKASDAERVYWENSRDEKNKPYAVVMVHDGVPILKDVRIGDKSIVDIVREINRSED